MSTPADQQPAQPHGPMPTIVINNVSAASASTTASAGGYGRRRRQSVAVHTWLLLLTGGIGNVLYAMHISRWNRTRGL